VLKHTYGALLICLRDANDHVNLLVYWMACCFTKTFDLQAVGGAATPFTFGEAAISCGGGVHNYMVEFQSGGSITIQVRIKQVKTRCLKKTVKLPASVDS
jgi:hypothetical protein